MSPMDTDKPDAGKGAILNWFENRINLTELFALFTSIGLFYVDVDTQKPLRPAVREALAKPMASYARWPRVLGPLAVLFFLFQGVSGVLLAFYYRASPSEAYESLRFILRDVHFGWLLHQVHRWGGQLLVAILILRMVRFFVEGIYKKPRELLWVSAALLLLVATHADFTGRLLTWNQISYWSTVRGVELFFTLPVIGPLLAFFVGGQEITGATLSRFYFLHIVVLPALILLLFYINFASVRRIGLLTTDAESSDVKGRQQYRDYLYNLVILVVLILGVLVSLAVLQPVPFRPEIDLFSTPVGIQPAWYLLASHTLAEALAGVPDFIKGTLLLALLLLVVFWPFVDRSPGRSWRERAPILAFGVVALLLWFFLTIYGLAAGGGAP
jgi:quinol-cytochrome oxidoreductase complex cytochrome b subunit